MNKGLSEYEKYKVIRPVIGGCELDTYDMPIVRKTEFSAIDWEHLKITGVQNASVKNSDKNTMITMFSSDKRLLSLWNEPLKKIGLFHGFAAVCTPDYSLYPTMNINDIRHNIYKARWLGATWQNYHCTVLPTVGWVLPDTYDLCFSGLEYGSVVVISTIGCQEKPKEFLAGFREMKARLNPPLIIVYGDMIPGMTGTFLNFPYEEGFCRKQKYEQLRIEGISRLFTVEEVA